ncbi:MAG TPA: hypothetical protein VMG08_20980 [Allosphingosinicella sp.]|nr:hypothetical protein [Allosphingosinicella sp.]
MTRYFFHLVGRSRWEDEQGEDFPDLATACRCAVKRFAGLSSSDPYLSIQLTARDGVTLFTVSPGRPACAAGGHKLH